VTLMSTVVAFLIRWGLNRILIGLGPLHILIPSVWSLIAVGAWSHVAVSGDKSLSSWLRHCNTRNFELEEHLKLLIKNMNSNGKCVASMLPCIIFVLLCALDFILC
jgi:hypothetical protein